MSLSIIVAITLFFITRYAIRKKMHNLTGTQKLLGIVSIFIMISEIAYLGTVLEVV